MTVRTMRATAMLAVLCATAIGVEWQGLPPPPRSLATIVVDTTNHRAVLFGGGTYNNYWNDVWTMSLDTADGYRWKPLSTSGQTPAERCGHAAVTDPVNNKMVVFGGRDASGNALTDVYALDLGTAAWQQLSPSGSHPLGSVFISAVYSPARRSMIVFGGNDMNNGYNEVNELMLDSMKWHQISPSGTPPEARWSYNAFLDPDSNRLIVFGGQTQSGQFANDVWTLGLTPGSEAWTKLSPGGAVPEGRANCATCLDEARRRAYFFGGFNYNQGVFYNDLYMLDMNTVAWSRVSPTGTLPSERRCPAGALDPWNRNFIAFGGETYDGFTDEGPYIYVGDLGIADWHSLEPSQPPWLKVTTVNSRQVSIRYSVPGSGTANLRIVDLSGRVVRNLLTGVAATGNRELVWDGRDEHGKAVASGSYFCYLETGQTGLSKKFVLSR